MPGEGYVSRTCTHVEIKYMAWKYVGKVDDVDGGRWAKRNMDEASVVSATPSGQLDMDLVTMTSHVSRQLDLGTWL